jgi:hypothetical protein
MMTPEADVTNDPRATGRDEADVPNEPRATGRDEADQ